MQSKLTILLTTFNFLEHTKECLISLIPALREDYELIIIDNCSTDGTQEFLNSSDELLQKLRRSRCSLNIIINLKDLGIYESLNIGFRTAQSNYIFWLHNDTLVKDIEIFEKLYSDFQNFKNVGIAVAMSNYVGTSLCRWPAFSSLPNKIISTNKIDSVAAMISKKCWNNCGGFNPAYNGGGYDDTEFCMIAKQKGYQILIDGRTFLFHKGDLTFRATNGPARMVRGRALFLKRWGSYPKEEILPLEE